MIIKSMEQIEQSHSYTVIYRNSQEVAVFGEFAPKEEKYINTNGNVLTDRQQQKLLLIIKDYMRNTRWDTASIKEQINNEWVYHQEEK
ncbi:hypothetical protein [Priestia aryabhattai]|uniref:hypothetical protein n=1 Tax=Priestia aryabhattai TaxID=412384 RepID=UPI003CB4AB9E